METASTIRYLPFSVNRIPHLWLGPAKLHNSTILYQDNSFDFCLYVCFVKLLRKRICGDIGNTGKLDQRSCFCHRSLKQGLNSEASE